MRNWGRTGDVKIGHGAMLADMCQKALDKAFAYLVPGHERRTWRRRQYADLITNGRHTIRFELVANGASTTAHVMPLNHVLVANHA